MNVRSAGETLKADVTVLGRPLAVRDRVYADPIVSMARPVNVAIPFTAAIVLLPLRIAPVVPVPEVMATVTSADEDVTVFPYPSSMRPTG